MHVKSRCQKVTNIESTIVPSTCNTNILIVVGTCQHAVDQNSMVKILNGDNRESSKTGPAQSIVLPILMS